MLRPSLKKSILLLWILFLFFSFFRFFFFFAWSGSEANSRSFHSHLLKDRDGFPFAGVKSLMLWSTMDNILVFCWYYFPYCCCCNYYYYYYHYHYVYSAEYHLGQLKAKIAKLRTQLLEPWKVCCYLYCLLLVSTSRFSFSVELLYEFCRRPSFWSL